MLSVWRVTRPHFRLEGFPGSRPTDPTSYWDCGFTLPFQTFSDETGVGTVVRTPPKFEDSVRVLLESERSKQGRGSRVDWRLPFPSTTGPSPLGRPGFGPRHIKSSSTVSPSSWLS